MQPATQYYAQIESMRQTLEGMLHIVERNTPAGDAADFSKVNWSAVSTKLQTAINKLQEAAAVHQFERVTRGQMLEVLKGIEQGTPRGMITDTVEHTLRQVDTLRSIELKYGVAYASILEYNGISVEAWTALPAGTVIHVPITRQLSTDTSLAVMGDQSGQNILGRDIAASLETDETGDLRALDPGATIAQAVVNLAATKPGDLAWFEQWGMNLEAGGDNPAEIIESMAQVEIMRAFEQDPRVKDVNVVSITRKGTAVTAEVEIRTITDQTLLTRV